MFMKQNEFWSYLAGFIDADGSIYVRLKKNTTYKYDFQVAPSIVIYQSKEAKRLLKQLSEEMQCGYLRERNDGIIELTIGDKPSIKKVLNNTKPYLRLKAKQSKLMLRILRRMDLVDSPENFIELTKLVDKFKNLNYSKKRIVNTRVVRNHLTKRGLLTP